MSEHKMEKALNEKLSAHAHAEPKLTVEQLAFDRDMLPELKPGTPPAHAPKAIVPPVHNPKFVVFARAKAFHRWVIGQELTSKEFDDAIAASEKASVYR